MNKMKLNNIDKNNIIGFYRPLDSYGFLSNFYPSAFTINGNLFQTAEQGVMYHKALLFEDKEIQSKILHDGELPYNSRTFGRMVKNFDQKTWDSNKVRIYEYVIYNKFKQNSSIRAKLIATGNAYLVEASPYDRIWGIGYSKKDKEFTNKEFNKWGTNLLGEVLMTVRAKFTPDSIM